MAGYSTITKVNTLRTLAKECGFEIDRDPYYTAHHQGMEMIALFPSKDEKVLPIYNRTMPIWTGDLDDCITFLRGWNEAFRYHNMLGFEKKRNSAEDKNYQELQFAKVKKAIFDADTKKS